MYRVALWVLTATMMMSPGLRAQHPLPADLASVPHDAIGFLHLRAADLWHSEFLKEFRTTLLKAGPKALAAFDERFVPRPSTIERLTLVILDTREGGDEPPFVGIVACKEPFDRTKAIQNLLPMGREMQSGGSVYFADAELDLAVRVIDDRTIAIASSSVMAKFVEAKPKSDGLFASALREAAGKHHLVLALNASLLPGEAIAELPEPLQPLARAQLAQLHLHLADEIRIDVRLQFGDEAQAKSGETAAHDGINMAREALKELRSQFEEQLMPKENKGVSPLTDLPEAALALAALGAIETGDQYLKELPIKREGATLAASVVVPSGPYTALLGLSGLSAGLAIPAYQFARMSPPRSRTANNLKQIMLAFHNYHDLYNGFPPVAICDKNGKPLLSWRVAILPLIEQEGLYRQFKLDEPWDSDHNKPLLAQMPPIYMLPGVNKPGDTQTHFRVFYGNGAALEFKKPIKLFDITDGTSNTGVVFEAEDAVEWTKPDEMEFMPTKPLPKLGRSNPEGFWVAMGDGSVRFVRKSVAEATLKALITRNGGEVLDLDP